MVTYKIKKSETSEENKTAINKTNLLQIIKSPREIRTNEYIKKQLKNKKLVTFLNVSY